MGILVVFGVGSLAAQNEETGAAGQRQDPKVVAEKMVAGWQKDLENDEDLARSGEEKQARPGHDATSLLVALADQVVTGHEELVARALRLSALANLAKHDNRAAMWAIEAARLFWPKVTDELDSFGPTGKRLVRLLHEDMHLLKEARALDLSKRGILPPRPLTPLSPRYPEPARVAKLEGTVALRVVIDRAGDARWPEITDGGASTRATALLLSAVNTLRATHFQPATKRGSPVVSFYTIDLKFSKP